MTISGTTASETISDLTTYEEGSKEKETLENKYVRYHNKEIDYPTYSRLCQFLGFSDLFLLIKLFPYISISRTIILYNIVLFFIEFDTYVT